MNQNDMNVEKIMQLTVKPNIATNAILDCLKTLKIPLEPLPRPTFVAKAAANFMGKYDNTWIGVTHSHYNQHTMPCFKILYNKCHDALKNVSLLQQQVKEFKVDPKMSYPGFSTAINDW